MSVAFVPSNPHNKSTTAITRHQIPFTFINTIKFSNCFQKNDEYDITN